MIYCECGDKRRRAFRSQHPQLGHLDRCCDCNRLIYADPYARPDPRDPNLFKVLGMIWVGKRETMID